MLMLPQHTGSAKKQKAADAILTRTANWLTAHVARFCAKLFRHFIFKLQTERKVQSGRTIMYPSRESREKVNDVTSTCRRPAH